MSEDANQLPGDPEKADQSPTEASSQPSPQEPAPPSTPEITAVPHRLSSTPPPASEVYVQPAAPRPSGQPQYPPPPEFYAQQRPVANSYGAPPAGYGFPPSGPAGTPLPPFGNAVPPFPPPPVYGYASYGYGYPPPPREQRPLPLSQAIRDLPRQYKKILFKPGARTFIEEEGKADWGIIWMQILFLMVLSILIAIPQLIIDATSSSVSNSSLGMSTATLGGVSTLATIVFVPLGFFMIAGIQYLLARAFKGIGSFKQQAYNQLLYQVPINIATSLVSLVVSLLTSRAAFMTFTVNMSTSSTTSALNPLVLVVSLVADLIYLAVGVYGIVLNVFSLMAAHRMSGGRATGSVLIPYGVLFVLLFVCIFVVAFVIAMAAYSSVHP